MPHLFVSRPRLHVLTHPIEEIELQFAWETINAVVYMVGGVVFLIGSIFFFPRLEPYADIGVWIFVGGSLLYLVVTIHDLAESIGYYRAEQQPSLMNRLELAAAAAYLVGTILFTIGSILFLSQINWISAGAWCFIVGSLLFIAGACVNVLQIISASDMTTLQLMNLTAISFVVGSVLFAVASVPYLWQFKSEHDRVTLFNFLACQFLMGSGLFLAGGIFNYWRAFTVMRTRTRDRTDASTPSSVDHSDT